MDTRFSGLLVAIIFWRAERGGGQWLVGWLEEGREGKTSKGEARGAAELVRIRLTGRRSTAF